MNIYLAAESGFRSRVRKIWRLFVFATIFSAAARADSAAPLSPLLEAASAPTAQTAIEKSVVRIFAVQRGADVFQPWQKQSPHESTASGIVIEGKRILTTSKAVRFSNEVQVQADLAGDKVPATVELVSSEMDLAVLKLDDESFFETHPPIERTPEMPSIKDPVFVYGYPSGGASLSITKGIVSRIEFTQYGFPSYGLRVQVDAALNEGNSGGPAVVGTRMIGMTLSHLGGTEKIGYIVPNEEIALFLKNLPSGKYTSKPGFYDSTQPLQNTALRAFLKLIPSDHGILIRKTDSNDPAYPLREWDLIEKIGNYPIDDLGMTPEGALTLDFHYAVQREAQDGKVSMDVVRAGKHLHLLVPIPNGREMLVPGIGNSYPPYFIYGPIVFTKATQALTTPILSPNSRLMGGLTWVDSPLVHRRGDRTSVPGDELIVVPCPFFPNRLGIGYAQPFPNVVASINDTPVRNLRELVTILRDARTDFIVIRFVERDKEAIVLPRAETVAATEQILSDNGVRAQASEELLKIWRSPSP